HTSSQLYARERGGVLMRNDHFDPQHLDEQINQCLVESSAQDQVAAQVIRDLQQEALSEEHQEALQRVWQRVASHQASISSREPVGLGQQQKRSVLSQKRRYRLMQSSPTPQNRKKPRISALAALAASLLIVGSMLAIVTLLHGKQSRQTAPASSP